MTTPTPAPTLVQVWLVMEDYAPEKTEALASICATREGAEAKAAELNENEGDQFYSYRVEKNPWMVHP